ncbi:hypothetical protein A6D99_16520 [Aliivibrio fischeri]|nr:hypothetical protein A6D99_16520 [Aliivibrio fischeri]
MLITLGVCGLKYNWFGKSVVRTCYCGVKWLGGKLENIEKFNLTVSEILSRSYESFPSEINFYYRDIAFSVAQYYGEDYFQDNGLNLEIICRDTMTWLEQAGYLWLRFPVGQEQSHGVRLSPKALELMNMIPTSLDQKKSIGDILLGGVKETGKLGALDAIKALLSAGVTLIGS